MRVFRSHAAILFLLVSLPLACKREPQVSLGQLQLIDTQGNTIAVKDLKGARATAFLFLSPDCPLCINVSKTINEMAEVYTKSGVSFITVFPGNFYTADTINSFRNQYRIGLPALMDEAFQLTKMVNATVTPQVVVMNTEEQIIYTGAIDDRSKKLGEKSQVIQHPYLKNVLDALLANEAIPVKVTEPVGCYIEFE